VHIYIYIQGVYKRMVRFQKFIKWLHFATGRCSPHFHRNVRELLNRVLQQLSAGSDVLQMETTTSTYYMVRIRLSCGCVSYDPVCSHWRIMINAYKNLDSCRCWRCTFCPCKMRNKFLVNFLKSYHSFVNTLYIYFYCQQITYQKLLILKHAQVSATSCSHFQEEMLHLEYIRR
jgi:hypothetical protein